VWCSRKTAELAPRLLDSVEESRQLEVKRAQIQAYRQSRAEINDRRERDRKLRNSLKALQFRLYQQMQVGQRWTARLSWPNGGGFIVQLISAVDVTLDLLMVFI